MNTMMMLTLAGIYRLSGFNTVICCDFYFLRINALHIYAYYGIYEGHLLLKTAENAFSTIHTREPDFPLRIEMNHIGII